MFISAFDLDKTLLTANSSFLFGKHLYSRGVFSIPLMVYLVGCYAAHAAGCIAMDKIHSLNFKALFLGRSRSAFQRLAAEFLDDHLDALIYRPAYEAYLTAKNAGHTTALMSSSPDFLVEAIAERLGFPYTEATRYIAGPNGNFASLGTVMSGHEKARALRQLANQLQVSQENIYAYSDSHLDLPFMEAAGHPVAVRPNRQMRAISARKGWKVLS